MGPSVVDRLVEGEVEASVIAAARQGDAAAFETILRHYDRRLRVVASRVLDERQLMDDALQEVAVRMLRGLSGYRGDAPLGAWLCRITATTCVDVMRRRRPEVPMPADEIPQPLGADLAEGLGAKQRLEHALARLPVDQRVAVLLIDQFGYDFRAAASCLDVPVGTVASRVATARARLREALATGEET